MSQMQRMYILNVFPTFSYHILPSLNSLLPGQMLLFGVHMVF